MKISHTRDLFEFIKMIISKENDVTVDGNELKHEQYINRLTRERMLRIEENRELYERYVRGVLKINQTIASK